jgi:large subunit ribosomal protein L19e
MSLKTVKRIAARLLKCGQSRIRIKDAALVKDALTSEDVRSLIQQGAIYRLPVKGVGRAKAERKAKRKQAGRRRGPGSDKGTPSATLTDKERWMRQVRGQRKLLKSFHGQVPAAEYRRVYMMVKGSAFRSRKQLLAYMNKLKESQTTTK